MNIEYDPEVDGAYIWLVDIERDKVRYSAEIRPSDFHDEIGFLLDDAGKIIGIEVQPASKYLDASLLRNLTQGAFPSS